jgi:hypothetical protein
MDLRKLPDQIPAKISDETSYFNKSGHSGNPHLTGFNRWGIDQYAACSGGRMILGDLIKSMRLRIESTCHLAAALFLILCFTLPSVSTAGGLYLNEFGTPSMGVAGAGASSVANDASTSFHNPAGMTRIKGNELMGTAGSGFQYAYSRRGRRRCRRPGPHHRGVLRSQPVGQMEAGRQSHHHYRSSA